MSEGHDHHLAATHLRGFSFGARRRRIWQLDLSAGSTRAIGVRDAGVKRGLNTLRGGQTASRDLEQFMAREVEDPAAPVLWRLRRTTTGLVDLTPAEDAALSNYITLAYARSPRNRARSAEHASTVALQFAPHFADPDAFARWLAAHGYRGDPLAAEVVRLKYWVALRDGRLPDTVPSWPISVDRALARPPAIVQVMTKAIVRRDREPFLVLGDCPVLLVEDGAYYEWGGLGFGKETVRVLMPLSPDTLLVCAPVSRERAAAYLRAWPLDDYAAFVNGASIAHAGRFVFGAESAHLERARQDHARVSAAADALVRARG